GGAGSGAAGGGPGSRGAGARLLALAPDLQRSSDGRGRAPAAPAHASDGEARDSRAGGRYGRERQPGGHRRLRRPAAADEGAARGRLHPHRTRGRSARSSRAAHRRRGGRRRRAAARQPRPRRRSAGPALRQKRRRRPHRAGWRGADSHPRGTPLTRPNRFLARVALAALLAVQGPFAAAPALAQSAGHTLNVQGADIRAFIQDVARSTGRTFIVDPAVTGTVTVNSDRPLSRSELFEVFLSTLR